MRLLASIVLSGIALAPLVVAGCQNARLPSPTPAAPPAPVVAIAPPVVVMAAVTPGPGAEVPGPIRAIRESLGARASLPATEVFQNIQTFRTLTADELLNTMAGFNRSLGVRCTACHVGGNWAAEDKPDKTVARHMSTMTARLNAEITAATGQAGTPVTCWTCHRGAEHPQTRPE